MSSDRDASKRATRARALRAAQVVTLSLSVTGLAAACGGGDSTPDAASSPDAFAGSDAFVPVDAPLAMLDAPGAALDAPGAALDAPGVAQDAPGAAEDAPGGAEDAPGAAQDAPSSEDAYVFMGDGGCGPAFPPTDQACCELAGGFWDGASSFCAIAVPGPFVPPSMDA